MNKPSNTLAVIGLVTGIIAILISFVPCLGTVGFIPGLIGLILGLIAFLKAKDNGHPKGLAISAFVVSLIACAISVYQIFTFGNMASDMKSNKIEYTNCTDLQTDYIKFKKDIKSLSQEMEENNASFSNITKIAKLGIKLDNIQKQSDKLGCDINIDELDQTEEIEEAVEGEGELEDNNAEEGSEESKKEGK